MIRSAFVAPIFIATVTFTLSAADWPMWRGPSFNGVSPETVAAWGRETPKQLWQAQVGTGFSSITVSDGRAFTLGFSKDNDHVVCLDANTGKELWRHSYPSALVPNMFDGGPTATPTVTGDKVFTLSRRGDAFALEAATGKVVWGKNLAKETGLDAPTWGLAGSPFVSDGVVFYNVGANGMALDAATGAVRWKSAEGKAGYATPVPFESRGRKLLAIFGGSGLAAVDPKDGALVWRHLWKTMSSINAADPLIVGNQILISSGYGRGAALLDVGGEQPRVVWENRNLRNQFTPSVVVDGFVFGFDGNTGGTPLRCLELASGESKWSERGIGTGGILVVGKRLLVLSDRGELMLAEASPEAFKPLSRVKILSGTCWTPPTLANGKLYARNSTGTLVCYGLPPEK
jgi:outer membrane protein assembly factor BamB